MCIGLSLFTNYIYVWSLLIDIYDYPMTFQDNIICVILVLDYISFVKKLESNLWALNLFKHTIWQECEKNDIKHIL